MGQKADNHHDNPNARHHQRFSQDEPHHYNSLASLNRLNLDIQAVKTRKLCPVQDGVISEDCECFGVESHDPSSFLVTNGIHTECPKTK